jgi:hypothetical protein
MIPVELENVLRAAGWRPGRRVSTSEWIGTLRLHGFSIVPEAEVALQEFGGLRVEPVRTPSDTHAPGVVIFDPLIEAELDRVADWQEQLGTRLTPIGQFSGQSCLLLAEDGSVYILWDQFLWKVGSSLLDALANTLLFGRRRPVEVYRRQL